jgi:hypothetical protein
MSSKTAAGWPGLVACCRTGPRGCSAVEDFMAAGRLAIVRVLDPRRCVWIVYAPPPLGHSALEILTVDLVEQVNAARSM